MENEEWRPVAGYEGLYEVSSEGRVRSLSVDRHKGIILRPTARHRGYYRVFLSKNRLQTTKKIHRLVAQAFVANPDGKSEVNHKSGDKADNRALNLEWATAHENTVHAYAVGLRSAAGERNGRHKLTPHHVQQLRSLRKRYNHSFAALGRKFNIHKSTARSIAIGKLWPNVA